MAELTPDPAPGGALIHYYLAQEPNEEVRLRWWTTAGEVDTHFQLTQSLRRKAADRKLINPPGLNRLAWQMFYPGPEMPEGAVVWGYTGGVVAPPGTYRVRMTIGEQVRSNLSSYYPTLGSRVSPYQAIRSSF
ncbi:MAG: hypothetical protein Ct9H300mP15_30260 [Gemmatimonadota bacterium]|nr:MAG: hypothetical protein Ct9H300mP15_30260 [Gemmatimonadota bacterium]